MSIVTHGIIESTPPQLPSECLYLIVDHLQHELKSLRNLLLVSRFFFNATVPLLLRLPIILCSRHLGRTTEDVLEDRLNLKMASIIHSQRALSISQNSTPEGTFSAEGFLATFGLQLKPTTSPLLQNAVLGVSPTTINYAQYPIAVLRYLSGIRRVLTTTTIVPRMTPPFYALNSDVHDSLLGSTLETRFLTLLLICCPESITELDIHVSKAHLYLPFADKLSHLEILWLRRELHETLPATHLHYSASLIVKNRTSFPMKKPLDLRLDTGWDCPLAEEGDMSVQEKQDLVRKYQEPRVALYEALGSPTIMDATDIPRFYDMCKNIGLDSLKILKDFNSARLEKGEGPSQETFLKRCHQLRDLHISVGSLGLFSWAVKYQPNDALQAIPGNFLRSLQYIELDNHVDLTVLNNVAVAFGKSLRGIRARTKISATAFSLDDPLRPSRQSRLGDWNLPFIREIHFELQCFHGIYLGDFSQCPQLEKLVLIIYGKLVTRTSLTDTTVEHGYLAPVWNLTCLKFLQVCEAASIMFNYDSLDHMPRLESLVMISKYEYLEPHILMPRLSRHLCVGTPSSRINAKVGQEDTKWKDQWDALPKLRNLRLYGPPSAVFCFNWLKGLPSLQMLQLSNNLQPYRRIPLSSLSQNSTIVPTVPSMDLQPESGVDNTDDSGFDSEMAPLVESKLVNVHFEGRWAISEHDLDKVLSFYAPNIQRLSLSKIHAVSSADSEEWLAKRFLQITMRARQPQQVVCHYNVSEEAMNSIGLSTISDGKAEQLQKIGEQTFSVGRLKKYARKEAVDHSGTEQIKGDYKWVKIAH
ncbi:hypothetical protein BGZ93_009040 [Podila epicladia]|nr:hypothetical protein BGZ92_006778 [Podila epicladia]KAG0091008.1 hypothetical protein BGZ93_009040 [Podila epicladia]